MPYLPITCTINGGPEVDTRELDMSLSDIALTSLQQDTASLSWTRRNATTACPVLDSDVVELFVSGRRIFRGRARVGGIRQNGASITLRGPWSYFDDYYWQVDFANGSPLGSSSDGVWTARMPLFGYFEGATTTWPSLPILYQLEQILACAMINAAEPYLPAGAFFYEPAGVRDMPLRGGVKHEVQDLLLSDAIRQCLAPQPDVACWYGYDVAGLPTINFRAASLEVPMPFTVGASPLIDYELDLLHELVPDGILIAYETEPSAFTGRGQRTHIDRWPATAGSLLPRVQIQTLPNSPAPIFGGARALHETMSVLRSAGKVVVQDNDFSLGLRPGMVLDILGDSLLAAYTVQHWVQTVRWSPMTGQATCTVGYPAHLGLKEILDMARFVRRAIFGSSRY